MTTKGKLDKVTLKRRDAISAGLRARMDDINAAAEAYNEASPEDRADESEGAVSDVVTKAIKAYNEEIDNANQYCSEIAADIDGYMEEKSEGWRDGEKGQTFETWKDGYEEKTFDQIEFGDLISNSTPSLKLDTSDVTDVADELDQMPEEAEG